MSKFSVKCGCGEVVPVSEEELMLYAEVECPACGLTVVIDYEFEKVGVNEKGKAIWKMVTKNVTEEV